MCRAENKILVFDASSNFATVPIQDHPANRINDLMPWTYQDMIDAKNAKAEAMDAA